MIKVNSVEWYLAWFFGGWALWFGMKSIIWIEEKVHGLRKKVRK